MLTIEKTVTMSPEQWEIVIEGMRNPKNSWDRSDSWVTYVRNCESSPDSYPAQFFLGPNDEDLMHRLVNGGPVHAKFRRMMPVWVTLKAPLYWWKEFDTYKVGTVCNSCSTMHKIHSRDLDLGDFSWESLCSQDIALLEGTIGVMNYRRKQYLELKGTDPEAANKAWKSMIQLLPTCYEQQRTLFLNYEVLTNIYESRKNHKLTEWHVFCKWIESLPYSEIITGKTEDAEGGNGKAEEVTNAGV